MEILFAIRRFSIAEGAAGKKIGVDSPASCLPPLFLRWPGCWYAMIFIELFTFATQYYISIRDTFSKFAALYIFIIGWCVAPDFFCLMLPPLVFFLLLLIAALRSALPPAVIINHTQHGMFQLWDRRQREAFRLQKQRWLQQRWVQPYERSRLAERPAPSR